MAGPEGDRLLHVDMSTQSVSFEDFPAEWKLFGLPPLSFSPRPIDGGVELVYYLSEAQAKQQGRGGVVEDGGECQRSALARPCTRPHPPPSASSLACAQDGSSSPPLRAGPASSALRRGS